MQERYLRKGGKLYAGQLIALRQRFAYILKALETVYCASGSRRRVRRAASALVAIEAEYHHRHTDAERGRRSSGRTSRRSSRKRASAR